MLIKVTQHEDQLQLSGLVGSCVSRSCEAVQTRVDTVFLNVLDIRPFTRNVSYITSPVSLTCAVVYAVSELS